MLSYRSLTCALITFCCAAACADPPKGMRLIPAGTFSMGTAEEELTELVEMGRAVPKISLGHACSWFGDELPRRALPVDAFYLDAHEVTNREYREFIAATGYSTEGDWEAYASPKRDDHPVVNVSWNDAQAYAAWAGKRLPTEVEWEYAAKGGRDVRWFPWGDQPDPSRAQYRSQGESFFAGLGSLLGMRKMNTAPVESFDSNGFGLFDMCGNVKEWVAAEFVPYPGAPEDERYHPTHDPEREVRMVYRGGGWDTPNAVFVRITSRQGRPPEESGWDLGFRCARSIP